MLTIKPIESKEMQEQLCSKCGVSFRIEMLAYSCYEGEKFVGICQFELRSGGVYIWDLENSIGVDDAGALFIMGRAALNFADLAGFHDAFYPHPSREKIATMIGFKENRDGLWYMDLRGFFESPCTCDKH